MRGVTFKWAQIGLIVAFIGGLADAQAQSVPVASDPPSTTQPTTRQVRLERRRHEAFLNEPVVFDPFVFDGIHFPKPGFKNPDYIEDLIGPYTLVTTFYDARYKQVYTADQPGRYGAIVRIKTESGKAYQRFLTLYRLPGPVNWDRVKATVATTLPAETGIDPEISKRQTNSIKDFAGWRFTDGLRHDVDGARLLSWLAELKPDAPAGASWDRPYLVDAEWWFGLKKKLNLPNYSYLTYMPASYDPAATKQWPLILFLHGSGQCGDRLGNVTQTGLPKWLLTQKDFPFLVVSPQCPFLEDWNPWALNALLDEVTSKYHVDTRRMYLTGLSLGGSGSWLTAATFPKRFAAVAPISAFVDPTDILTLKDEPIWVFHGGKDRAIESADQCVAALRAAGGSVKYTVYPDLGHDVWTKTYADPALYKWFLEQRPRDAEPAK